MDVSPDPEPQSSHAAPADITMDCSDNDVECRISDISGRGGRRTVGNQEHNKCNKLRQKEKDRMKRAAKGNGPFLCPWCDCQGQRSNEIISHVSVSLITS